MIRVQRLLSQETPTHNAHYFSTTLTVRKIFVKKLNLLGEISETLRLLYALT